MTNGPVNAPHGAAQPASAPISPHASSRDNASWAGAKHSTNSTSPTQDESGKAKIDSNLKDLYTPEVTSSHDQIPERMTWSIHVVALSQGGSAGSNPVGATHEVAAQRPGPVSRVTGP